MTMSDRAAKTFVKYQGDVASNYDAKRDDTPKRRRELEVLGEWLGEESRGAHVLDCPVGTGFLFDIHRRHGFNVLGMDSSPDMLAIARTRTTDGDGIALQRGSAFDMPFPDANFDVSLCIRLLNLIGATDMQQALTELQRVTRRRIIFNLRVWHAGTQYRNPQRIEDVRDVLRAGWAIARNVPIHENDFRMIMLEHRA